MEFFKRNKGKDTNERTGSSSSEETRSTPPTPAMPTMPAGSTEPEDKGRSGVPRETSPQRVGVVSGLLTTSATAKGQLEISDIVDRHFGPKQACEKSDESKRAEGAGPRVPALPPQREPLRAVENPLEDEVDSPRLEIDPMAHIGHATTITGSIVALEDLEIQGTIEGSIRLASHQLTVGSDGLVKANVEAHTVLVIGRISGDVVASELVEIKAGGVIGGDVKSPRVIMHDGGVVVGGLDMSASLPSSGRSSVNEEAKPERPRLIRVELPHDPSKDEGRV